MSEQSLCEEERQRVRREAIALILKGIDKSNWCYCKTCGVTETGAYFSRENVGGDFSVFCPNCNEVRESEIMDLPHAEQQIGAFIRSLLPTPSEGETT